MTAHEAIRISLRMGELVGMGYLEDLSDAEMMKRACPGINHIKWQVGHLILSEHRDIEDCVPGSMPRLPPDFAQKYSRDTVSIDDPTAFHTKDDLLRFYHQQREATLMTLDASDDAFLDQPAPEAQRAYAANMGALFEIQGSHWLMHCGQWAVVRRQLGRPPLF